MAGKCCQICGNYSGKYPLCYVHMKLIKTGGVFKNPNTGMWELTTENNDNDISIEEYKEATEQNFRAIINKNKNFGKVSGNGRCLVCGNVSKHSHICFTCKKNTFKAMKFIDLRKNSDEIKKNI